MNTISPEPLKFSNKRKLSLVLEAGNVATLELNQVSNQILATHKLEKIIDVKKNKLPKTFTELLDLVHTEDRDDLNTQVQDLNKSKKNFKAIFRLTRSDQSVRWIESSWSIFKSIQISRTSTIFIIFKDITTSLQSNSRIQTQFNLSQELNRATSLKEVSQNLLKSIAKAFDWQCGVLWLADERRLVMRFEEIWTESPVLEMMKENLQQFAFSPGQGLIGRVWETNKPLWIKRINSELLTRRKLIMDKYGVKSLFAFPVRAHNKTIAVFEFYSLTVKDRDQLSLSIIETIRSNIGQVIERQIISKENAEIRQQLESIFKIVPIGISVEDREGKIIYSNQEMAKIFHLNPNSNLVGSNIKVLFSPYKIIDENAIEHSFEQRPAAKVFQGLVELSENLCFINKRTHEEIWLAIKAAAVKNNGSPELVIKSYKDISKTIETQKQRELFLGVVSHEFKSPLASIKAYSQLLKRKLKNEPQGDLYKYSHNIEMQTNRITKIIGDYLDITRLKSGNFKLNRRTFNLNKLVQKVIENLSVTYPDFKIQLDAKMNVNFFGDEDRIVQVLLNLLINSIEHSQRGDSIDMVIRTVDDFVEISVRDYGIGIPKKYQNQIFKLYRSIPRASDNYPTGVGMGLYISQSIIKSHGGQIELISQANKGAEFIIKLPIISAENS